MATPPATPRPLPDAAGHPVPAGRRPDLLLAAALFATVWLCYANSLRNPFIWDHEVTIVENPIIRSFANVPAAFQYDLFGKPMTGSRYYRPLGVLTYMLDYRLWGLDPFGYHLTSVALHGLVVLLLFHFLGRLGAGRAVAFASALLFAVHPVNTETVTYLFREDSLAALFSLACFLCHFRVREGRRWYALPAVLCYGLALLAKESAVVTPFLILAEHLLHRRRAGKGAGAPAATALLLSLLVALSLGYTAWRLLFLTVSAETTLSLIGAAPLWHRLLTVPRILLTYLGLLVVPTNLHAGYHFVTQSPLHPSVLLGVPLLAGLAAGFLLYLRALAAPADAAFRDRLLLFALWFLLGLAPFTNVPVTLHATLMEHWAYFPGMGLIALLVSLGARLRERARGAAAAGAVVLLFGLLAGYDALATVRRNREWREPLEFYLRDLAREPRNFLLHTNVGAMYYRQGRLEEARRHFLQAIEVSPGRGYDVAYNNVGLVYEYQGRPDLAELAFTQAIRLNGCEGAYHNLSRLYLETGRPREALSVAQEGARRYPLNTEVRYRAGVAHLALGQPEEARSALLEAARITPGYKDVDQLLRGLPGTTPRR